MSSSAFLDGVAHEIKDGESLYDFIERNIGKGTVPTLCYDSRLESFGSCRVCSVEIALEEEGPRRVVASCHTPVTENLYVFSTSARIKKLRKNIVELVLTDYPHDLIKGNGNGDRELHEVVKQVGLSEIRYAKGETHNDIKKDISHAYMRANLSKCINCYRCVRACDEIQGQFVLNMHGRGFDNRIIMGNDQGFADSTCVSCGACAQTCPTGAITDIFDSMAAPNAVRKERTVCSYCGVGCNLEVAVDAADNILSITAPSDAVVNEGHTCLKGRYAFKFQSHPDRLKTPLIKRNGKFEPATWDEAYGFIAERLTAIKEKHGPDSIAGISSARCTNEENYLLQKFIRAVIGTNNIDCCARVCHSPTALGMQMVYGTGAATNSIDDIKQADLFLVVGANPTDAHPVTGAKIKQAVMKGAPLILIDPMKIELAKYAKYHLALRPGTNIALLNIFTYYIISEGLVDEDFVERRCEDFEEFSASIRTIDIHALEATCGVERALIREAAIAYATANNAMEFHGLGVTEHSQGTRTVTMLAGLAMMTGNIGRPGVGVNPLRGQNNVQGAADMGAQPHQGAGYLDVTQPAVQQKYSEFYGRPVSSEVGYKIPEMFDAACGGKLKALWLMGEDVVQSDPNTQHVIDALSNLELLVVQEILPTETGKLADVILPATTFLEKSGTFTNGERRVQRVNAVVPPAEGTKTDGQIVVDIMNTMGYNQADYDPDTMLREIAQIVPFFAGIKWDELGENGKQWPVTQDGKDTQILHTETFKRGKGKFYFTEWKESVEIKDNRGKFPYILTTGRKLEHYNCGTMTRRTNNAMLLKEDTLVIHPKDAKKKGIKTGDMVRLFSRRGEIKMKSHVEKLVKPGILYTTFHFPDQMINYLTSDVSDGDSMCPEYKVVAVDFEPATSTPNEQTDEPKKMSATKQASE